MPIVILILLKESRCKGDRRVGSKHGLELVDTYTLCGRAVTRGKRVRSDLLGCNERKLGAVIILFDEEGNLLLQKRTGTRKFSGKWDFTAGGGAQCGETSKEAVQREFKEETGLNFELSIDEPIAVCRDKDWLIVYYAQIVERGLLAEYGKMNSEEVSEFKWVSVDEFDRLCASGEFRGDIKKGVCDALHEIHCELWECNC